MTMALTGTGGVYTRFGKEIGLVNAVDTFRGGTTNVYVSAVYAQYQSNEQIAVTNLYQNTETYRAAHDSWVSQTIQVARTSLIEQANRDNPLSAKTVYNAVALLKQQMETDSQSINRPTVAATAAAGSGNDGDGVLVASTVGTDGLPQDYAMAEVIDFTVAGGTAYQESVSVQGDPSRPATDYAWPGGSGVSSSATVQNAATGTLVSNGSFEDWPVANAAPTSWTLVTGAWGTDLTRSTSPLRTSENYALAITSDGATQQRFRQQVTLQASTVYAANVWAKISATAAGTLKVKLVDGSGTTINDEAGTANEISIDTSSGLSTSYQAKSGFFRTPRSMPTTVYLDVHLTTPPTSGRVITLDHVALAAADVFGASSPASGGAVFAKLFSGATANPVGDAWTLTVTNSLGKDSFARSLDRFLDLRSLALKIPSAASPTIPDNLIG